MIIASRASWLFRSLCCFSRHVGHRLGSFSQPLRANSACFSAVNMNVVVQSPHVMVLSLKDEMFSASTDARDLLSAAEMRDRFGGGSGVVSWKRGTGGGLALGLWAFWKARTANSEHSARAACSFKRSSTRSHVSLSGCGAPSQLERRWWRSTGRRPLVRM